tara:strand:- start:594 stop:818 length:225 start_codon:yes stop_codon:yes gene_type:complete
MVGKIMSKPEKRKTPGKKMMTTTYKKGGTVKKAKGGKVTKKNMGGMMPGNQMPGAPMMPNAGQNMKKGGSARKK